MFAKAAEQKSKIQKRGVGLRPIPLFYLALLLGLGTGLGCTSLPTPKVKRYEFPKEAYLEDPERPFETLGLVRTKVTYGSFHPEFEEEDLCKNAFNKAARDLVRRAKKQGADAVVRVRSVVFLMDGKIETHPQPECVDEGEEGQLLAQAVAIRWKKPRPPTQD